MSNSEIEKNEALARIKGLENELANGWQRDRIKALEDRIEQLEAALRWIADIEPEYEYHGTLNAQVVRILETARAALAPEQDK